ncbi:hypothetical protein COX04_00165, partial [Candidatus Woesebacteria bacterium CG22_combo_CG10-13_8_21_14_all_45_10]
MNLLWWVRHLFVPRHSNNHRAKILHPSTLSVVVAFFLIYQFAINFYLLVAPAVLGFASNITPEQVIALTNQKRAEQGLSPLTINGKLNEAAQRKAGDMFAFNYWAHNSPSGRNPWAFFQEVDYKYTYAGENLARDFMNSEGVVEAWMNSPTHRDNILNSNYKETGLAVVNGTLNGVETTLVVQLFGTPTPAPIAQRPQITSEASIVEEKTPLALPVALAQARGETTAPPLLSPFWLTKTIAIFLLGIILGALVLDIILVYQRRIIRLSGRN